MDRMERNAAVETEDDKLARPCFEGYVNGAWWEVDIHQRRQLSPGLEKFLIRYIGVQDEDDEWVSLDFLRLRARRTDDWDCTFLRRGVDVSVSGVHHPQAEQLRPPKTMASYDAKIVKVSKSRHDLDCCCKFFIQFYAIKDGTSLLHGVDRPLVKNQEAGVVNISQLSVLQQPGVLPLAEILKAHISTKAEDKRWSEDALFLKETELRIFRAKGAEGSMNTSRGAYPPDEGVAKPGGLWGTLEGQHFGVRSPLNVADIQTTTRHGNGRADAAPETRKTDVNEGDHRGMKSPQHNTIAYPDHGMKRKLESDEKDSSNMEDYSPGVGSRFTRSMDPAAGGSRRYDQNAGHEKSQKVRESVNLRGGRKPKMTDSESSPVEDVPQLGGSDHSSERDSNRDVFLRRGRREEEQPGKVPIQDEHRRSRDEHYKATEQSLKNKSCEASKEGKSQPMKSAVDDEVPDSYYNTQKAHERSSVRMGFQPDEKPEENIFRRKRGRPRKQQIKYELREKDSPKMNDNQSRPKHHSTVPESNGKPDADLESPSTVNAFASTQEVDTSREIGRREKGKLAESNLTRRSGERLPKASSAELVIKQKEPEKGGNDPGSAKTDLDFLPSQSFDDPTNKLGYQQRRKLRPRVPLKSTKSLPILSKSSKCTEKERGAKEKVVDGPPLYKDLFGKNWKEDDESELQHPANEKKPDFGLHDTWPQDSYSEDSACEIISTQPLQKTLWQEYDEPAPAVGTEQALPLTRDRAAQRELHDSDSDNEGNNCEHKNQLFKDDVGRVCCDCAIITESIEDVIPQVEIPQRRAREADLEDWDFDKYSPDVGAVGYDQIKNEEVVPMVNTSLPPHFAQKMHPHQKEAFEFLWKHLGYDAEGKLRTKMAAKDRNLGCILAHAPGTGKSFLTISFLKSYLNTFPQRQPLIVAPKVMLIRWQKEFAKWKSDIRVWILNLAPTVGKRLLQKHEESGVVSPKSYHMNSRGLLNACRMAVLYEWAQGKSVCLVSYNLFSNLIDAERSNRTQEGRDVRKCLLEATGIIILDEGHFPRNKGTRVRSALLKVRTHARILLSGTVFQNNFGELFNTLDLVRPGFYLQQFTANDLGLSSDRLDDDSDGKLADDRHLDKEESTTRRARKIFEEIGQKIEEWQFCKESEVLRHAANSGLQKLWQLTAHFIHHHTGEVLDCLPGLRDFGILLKPTTLQCSLLEVVESRFQTADEYLKREITVSECSIHPKLVTKLEFANRDIINLLGPGPRSDLLAMLDEPSSPGDGVKTKFVFDLLGLLRSTNEKVLVFSQHMAPLDLLEEMLKDIFNWDKNKDVLRLDGSMGMNDREAVIERFNDHSSLVQILLASTKACGEGINLVGASRVVFLDVLWNPAVIKQAVSRAFRLGQKKIVYVYRLIAKGSIEEKKYKKAIRKDFLSMSLFTAGEADGETAVQTEDPLRDQPESMSLKDRGRGEGVGAWEVDSSTCEDDLLEKLMKNDKNEGNSFVQVVEHGSRFNTRKSARGPEVRDWFKDDKDLLSTKAGEWPGVETPNAEKLHEDDGEIREFDEDSSNDSDEEIL